VQSALQTLLYYLLSVVILWSQVTALSLSLRVTAVEAVTFLVNVPLKLLSPEAFFSSECTKCRLAARLRLDRLGEFTALPQTL